MNLFPLITEQAAKYEGRVRVLAPETVADPEREAESWLQRISEIDSKQAR
jgi:hypothetical protein